MENIQDLKNMISALKDKLENCILEQGEALEYEHMYTKELERAIKHAGFDLKKIYVTKEGRFKVSNPIQLNKKHYKEVLEALYSFYYHENEEMNYTLEQCFHESMMRFRNTFVANDMRSDQTLAIYESNWKRFFSGSKFAEKPIRMLKTSQIHSYLEELASNQDLSGDGLADAKLLLSKAFGWAVNHDIIALNPIREMSTKDIPVRIVDNAEKVYTNEERDKLLQVMSDEEFLSGFRKGSLAQVAARALSLAFCLTVRSGEVRSFKWSDVDWENETIAIHSQIRRYNDAEGRQKYLYSPLTKAKSKRGNRTPSLSDRALTILRKQREYNPSGVYIFESNGHELAENTLNQWLRRFCDRADVEYKPTHCIRFWSVTNLYDGGLSQGKIQHAAGHLDPATTDHYKRVSRLQEITKEEANRLYG